VEERRGERKITWRREVCEERRGEGGESGRSRDWRRGEREAEGEREREKAG
jgi:hypothetical protein